MRRHRLLARWFAGLLVVGAVAAGTVAPAEAASCFTKPSTSTHGWRTQDTGWGGT
jgi:hypothetical protein